MVLAAGGVVWSGRHPQVEVALIHRNKYDDWSLPKGKLHPGEAAVAAALREVWEETGVQPTLGPRLVTSRYFVRERPKSVEYWALRGRNGRFEPSDEVDRVAWLPLDEARRTLSYERDAEVLDVFARVAVAVDSVILLVRHAWAGDPQTWTGENHLRPLDAEGRRQAEELRRALARFEPVRVVTADLARCIETLAPLAADLGVDVEIEPKLADKHYRTAPGETLGYVDELATNGQTIALCAQGTSIPAVVRDLTIRHGLELGPNTEAAKGSVWALFFSQGRLLAADYYAEVAGWPT